MELDLGITGAKRSSYEKGNPKRLLADILREHRHAGLEEVTRLLFQRIEADVDRADHVWALVVYYASNHFRYMVDEEHKTTGGKPRVTRSPDSKVATKAARESTVAKIKSSLKEHIAKQATILFLELLMPNGKKLRNCSGADCGHFGGFYKAIQKRIGDRAVVGEALSEGQIQEMAAKLKFKP